MVGSSNQFAHAAARAVAEIPSKSYNPLFIYGGVGLGKTHLMHAIGHYILARQKRLNVLYISTDRFINEMINAIRFDRLPAFRQKYRAIDVLLIDDIQFIAGKDRTQEEFFHIFNALHDAQKQIVVSSDCPPRQIPTIEERLHSRFEWGLIADIQPPDIETKVAILRKKAEAERVELPENVALFIASKVQTNIRELEGSLIRLIAYASLTGRDIDLPLAQETLRDLLAHRGQAGHDRDDPEVRGRPLQPEDQRDQGQEQLQVHRRAPPDRHVPHQEPHQRLAARDRQGVRRQAPLDRHPLGPQDRRPPQAGPGVRQAHPQLSCKHFDELARLFHTACACRTAAHAGGKLVSAAAAAHPLDLSHSSVRGQASSSRTTSAAFPQIHSALSPIQ